MMVVITGHQRSGTTMLAKLCAYHPQMAVTHEFGSLLYAGQAYRRYAADMLRRTWEVDARWGFLRTHADPRKTRLHNFSLTARYLLNLLWARQLTVGYTAVEAGLRRTFPQARVVGDKVPQYMKRLPQLVAVENLACVVIYRDCRDVTSSFLVKTRTDWKGQSWIANLSTAEAVARRWVNFIQIMEKTADRLHVIRYEDLVQQPQQTLAQLAAWLDVDAAGFRAEMVSARSVGNYRQTLTAQELAQVMAVAGPTMTRLGYE